MGVELSDSLILSEAIPRINTIKIPGRNGNVQQWDGSYENRTITAECYLLKHAIERGINEVNSWLVSEPGYFRFEDSEDPKHFMMARVTSGISKQLKASLATSFELVFDADPRRFLKSGERKILLWGTTGAPFKVFNPTAYPASPLLEITVEKYGNFTFGSGGGKIYVRSEEFSGKFYYDTDTDRAYTETGELNELVASEGSFRLMPGNNDIYLTANAGGSLNLIPRWWEI